MSRPKGLGSPHIRGSGQPQEAPLTRREVANELASGCGVLLIAPVSVAAGVAILLGIYLLAGFVTAGASDVVASAFGLGVFGVLMIVSAALLTIQLYRRRSAPEATPLALVLSTLVVLALLSLGAVALVSAVSREGGAPAF